MTLRIFITAWAVALSGLGCTNLTLDGDEQLSCARNADCPRGLACAAALGRCVDEAIDLDAPIVVDGDAVVDAPRISRVEGFARAVVTVTFTKAPSAPASALVDNRLALPCTVDDSGDKTWRCAFDARDFPDEQDGFYDVIVIGRDGAGNEARARARVEIDTVAPGIAPDSVAVVYTVADDPFDVDALGPGTGVVVQLSVTENAAIPPTLTLTDGTTLVDLVHDDARSVGPLHVFTIDGSATGGLVDGEHRSDLAVIDDVGNAALLDIGTTITVDRSIPPAPAVEVTGLITHERTPWGTRDDPTPRFALTGGPGAAEPGSTLVVTSGEGLGTTLLARTTIAADGSFVAALEVIDVPRVFVRVIDGAGNIGLPARVRDVTWTASLGGRVADDAFSNPHALFTAAAFSKDTLIPNLVAEPRRAGDLVDGLDLTTSAVPRRRDVRTTATGQPSRMSHAMGYLPTIGAPVIFGGVPARNRTQTADTFVLRNERWVPIVDNPPTNGALAYDTARRELVSLLVNGDTWGFDGTTWRQRPVAPIPTSRRGPVAWDRLLERLITVQGTETWALGSDDIWTRIGDAPIAGLATFDGLNGSPPGGVIAFDGVDGRVILYGPEGGGGAVYALVDDVWTRLGSAPTSSASTAIEDLESGRVHFVCRTVGGSTNGTMLTWDGTAMQTGPINLEPNSGCGATHDLARGRLLIHGGTGDGAPNVQALPQQSIATLDAGSSEWQLDFTGAAPPFINHNGGGTSHFNPILNRVVIYGATTSANLARVTTLLDGAGFVAASAGASPFGLPFFDGVRSRFVEGTSERFFDGAAWVSRTAAVFVDGTPSFTYDATADTAFGINGGQTFRLRGDVLTVLSPTTSPPPRQTPTLIHDPVQDRVVLVAGFASNNTGIVGDTWAFEGGTWRQLDDAPVDVARTGSFQDVGRHQLVFDRRRGVVVGFFDGALFDLRGDSWVPRAIDVPPRANSLMVYDEFKGDLLFVGGLEFELAATTSTRVDLGRTAVAHVVRFDLGAAGASADAVVENLQIDAISGATGADDSGPVHGVDLMMWGTSSFVSLATNTARATAPAIVTVTRAGPALEIGRGRDLILAVASAPTGPGDDEARVVTTQLELQVRYREP